MEKGILLTGGKDGQLIVFDVANAKVDHYGSSQARICFPSKMASHVQDHVTEVAWGTEGRIYSGHMSGEVRTWKCSSV